MFDGYSVSQETKAVTLRPVRKPLFGTIRLEGDISPMRSFCADIRLEDFCEYDLRWLELHFAGQPEDARNALNGMEFSFSLWRSRSILRLSGPMWCPLLPQDADNHLFKLIQQVLSLPSQPTRDRVDELMNGYARMLKAKLEESGGFWPHYFHRVGPAGKAIRVRSGDPILAEVWFPDGLRLSKPLDIRVCMQGILFERVS